MKELFKIIAVVLIWSLCGLYSNAGLPIHMASMHTTDGILIPRDFTEDIIGDRLDLVEGAIKLDFSLDSKKLIKRYMLQGRKDTKKLIERSFYYFPLFDHYFDKYNVPKELKYITLLESSLRPARRSKVGARGLWQFMPATARWMGLAVDNQEDERINPAISTEAAVRYLAQLYTQFDDWNLVLLAYNAGPGSVKRAIRKSNSTKVEDILPYLPKQTRKYLPFYTATVYALNYYMEYGIVAQPDKPSIINEMVRKEDQRS